MGFEVEYQIDFNGILDEVKQNTGIAFGRQLEAEKVEIIRRTQSGVDADGQPFADYTEPYKKYKTEKRKREGNVNLWLEGGMLSSMTTSVEVTPTSYIGKVFFSSALEAAKASGNMLKRKFFAFSEDQFRRLSEAIQQALKVNQ
jgi:hypothetical protein